MLESRGVHGIDFDETLSLSRVGGNVVAISLQPLQLSWREDAVGDGDVDVGALPTHADHAQVGRDRDEVTKDGEEPSHAMVSTVPISANRGNESASRLSQNGYGTGCPVLCVC